MSETQKGVLNIEGDYYVKIIDFIDLFDCCEMNENCIQNANYLLNYGSGRECSIHLYGDYAFSDAIRFRLHLEERWL